MGCIGGGGWEDQSVAWRIISEIIGEVDCKVAIKKSRYDAGSIYCTQLNLNLFPQIVDNREDAELISLKSEGLVAKTILIHCNWAIDTWIEENVRLAVRLRGANGGRIDQLTAIRENVCSLLVYWTSGQAFEAASSVQATGANYFLGAQAWYTCAGAWE